MGLIIGFIMFQQPLCPVILPNHMDQQLIVSATAMPHSSTVTAWISTPIVGPLDILNRQYFISLSGQDHVLIIGLNRLE